MITDDVQLINKILSGDDEAFTALVRKYQKSVHALAWRKIEGSNYLQTSRKVSSRKSGI